MSYDEAALAVWRAAAEAELRAPEGWLSVAGLFWLQPGQNRMGSDPTLEVVLPADAAPALVATLRLEADQVWLEDGAEFVRVNGEPPPDRALRPSTHATPDRLTVGRLALQLHASAGRLGIRVRDPEHPARRDFAGRQWFAAQDAYCVPAQFLPYTPPRPTTIATHDGEQTTMNIVGVAQFTLNGEQLQLEAFQRGDGKLFFVFRDATSGVSTYGAARFLIAEPPVGDQVVLDFNRAVSPPCAFTHFATCPLPPPQNRLSVAIPAGEQGTTEH
jgi:uncharacterized protein (DUF1684 family)